MSADFLDSNVLLYLASDDESRAGIVENLLAQAPVISAQVLNEVTNVLRRKMHYDWLAIDRFITRIVLLTKVLPLSEDTNRSARSLAERYGFAVYDAVIVASALEGGCTRLMTEDMHHGQKIGDLTITNPFR
jgi:predicted nucleic acid-binding protein